MAKKYGKAIINKNELEKANLALKQIESFNGIKMYRVIKDRYGKYIIGDICGQGFVDRLIAENEKAAVFNWAQV